MIKQTVFILLILSYSTAFAQKVIQADIRSILNVRIVTTFSDSKLVYWTDALDGGKSGMATTAAVLTTGDKTSKALPDDGVFPADESHPKVVLNYSNSKSTGFQARRSLAVDSFLITTPKKQYKKVFLFCMSGNGPSNLKFRLTYSDNSEDQCDRVVPDWFFDLKPTDTNLCILAKDLGKWDNNNKMMEANHHYLHGVILQPNSHKKLVKIEVNKDKKGVLTLWGVTLQR